MYEPKAIARSAWRDSMMELSAIYLIAVVGCFHLLSSHWLVAIVLAPVIMGAALLAVILIVESLYLLMVGIDRLGSALGLRKSPLS